MRRAFTLIEILLAVTLSVMLFGAMVGFYKYAADTRATVTSAIQLVQSRRQVMDRMTEELRAAISSATAGLAMDGTADSITFVTTAIPQPSAYNERRVTDTPPTPQEDVRIVSYGLQTYEDEDGNMVVGGIETGVQKLLAAKVIETDSDNPTKSSAPTTSDPFKQKKPTTTKKDPSTTRTPTTTRSPSSTSTPAQPTSRTSPVTGKKEDDKPKPTLEKKLVSPYFHFIRFLYYDGSGGPPTDTWNSGSLPRAVEIAIGREDLPEGVEPKDYPYELFRRVVTIHAAKRPQQASLGGGS